MAYGRVARRPRGQVGNGADRPRRPARGPAGGADGQLPGGPHHLQRRLARRGGGDAADLPGERGRAPQRPGRFRCGRRGDHGRVPAEGVRRPGRRAIGSGSWWCRVPGPAPARPLPGVPVLDFAQVEAAEPGSIVDRSGTDLAALLYTGGTTGRSKGVPLSHANLFWCGWAANQNSAGSRREHRARAAPPRACLRAPGLLHRLSPGRGRPGPSSCGGSTRRAG